MDCLKTVGKLQLCHLSQCEYYPGTSQETGCNWSHCSFIDYFLWLLSTYGREEGSRINSVRCYCVKPRAGSVCAGCTLHRLLGPCSSQSDVSDLRDLSSTDFLPLLLDKSSVRKILHRDEGRRLLRLQGLYMPVAFTMVLASVYSLLASLSVPWPKNPRGSRSAGSFASFSSA